MGKRQRRARKGQETSAGSQGEYISSPKRPPIGNIRLDFPNRRLIIRGFATKEMMAFYLQEFAGDDYKLLNSHRLVTSDDIRMTTDSLTITELLDFEVPERDIPEYFDKDRLIADMADPHSALMQVEGESSSETRRRIKDKDVPTETKTVKPAKQSGAISAIQIAKEEGVDPGQARAALRKAFKPKPDRWEWTNADDIAKARKIIKGAKK